MKTKSGSPPKDPDGEEVLRKCCGILSEHYDAVQILVCTVGVDGATRGSQRGSGNYYARVHLAQTFADRDRAENIADFIVKGLKD